MLARIPPFSSPPDVALMIAVEHLAKRYGTATAVDGLSFEAGPGRVTGTRISHGLISPTDSAEALRAGLAHEPYTNT